MAYHERTKHGFDGYARGPSSIDWDAQPDSFRRFEDTPCIQLPHIDPDTGPSYADLFTATEIPPEPWNKHSLSRLLLGSMALSAWKQYGPSRWSLRCNPSSGNLHPTETYLILINLADFENGVYHYRPDVHALELRCRFAAWHGDSAGQVLLSFSSVHWRESWKYGERAYRYCQLDIGHAIAAVSYAAASLGHNAMPVTSIAEADLRCILGLDQLDRFQADEAEWSDLMLSISPSETNIDLTNHLLEAAQAGEWFGQANRLDPRHLYDWPVIEEVAHATERPISWGDQTAHSTELPTATAPATHPLTTQSALRLFRQRRSAQAFDPASEISKTDFYRLMDRLLPRQETSPWHSMPWPARLHLIIFVHRVVGLDPGLYALVRRQDYIDEMKQQMRNELDWKQPDDVPAHLPLYHLVSANARNTAMKLSCVQDIAGNSAFSLGMLAEFEANIQQSPWRYDELFWEAGMIGQSLYLEAEAIGLRGTGIGCYFDDGVHNLIGIQGQRLRSMYHFTVGLPVTDSRLITLPPYGDAASGEQA